MNFIKKLWNSPLLREIVRFLIVGGGATVVDFLTMSLVLYLMQPEIYPDFLSIFFPDDSRAVKNAGGIHLICL